MTEPTKAPWRWEDVRDYDGRGDADALAAEERTVLSPTYSDSGIEWSNTPDARLIEKAPEMLALLRELESLETVRDAADIHIDVAFNVKVDTLVAYILGEPTREEEEASTDGP